MMRFLLSRLALLSTIILMTSQNTYALYIEHVESMKEMANKIEARENNGTFFSEVSPQEVDQNFRQFLDVYYRHWQIKHDPAGWQNYLKVIEENYKKEAADQVIGFTMDDYHKGTHSDRADLKKKDEESPEVHLARVEETLRGEKREEFLKQMSSLETSPLSRAKHEMWEAWLIRRGQIDKKYLKKKEESYLDYRTRIESQIVTETRKEVEDQIEKSTAEAAKQARLVLEESIVDKKHEPTADDPKAVAINLGATRVAQVAALLAEDISQLEEDNWNFFWETVFLHEGRPLTAEERKNVLYIDREQRRLAMEYFVYFFFEGDPDDIEQESPWTQRVTDIASIREAHTWKAYQDNMIDTLFPAGLVVLAGAGALKQIWHRYKKWPKVIRMVLKGRLIRYRFLKHLIKDAGAFVGGALHWKNPALRASRERAKMEATRTLHRLAKEAEEAIAQGVPGAKKIPVWRIQMGRRLKAWAGDMAPTLATSAISACVGAIDQANYADSIDRFLDPMEMLEYTRDEHVVEPLMAMIRYLHGQFEIFHIDPTATRKRLFNLNESTEERPILREFCQSLDGNCYKAFKDNLDSFISTEEFEVLKEIDGFVELSKDKEKRKVFEKFMGSINELVSNLEAFTCYLSKDYDECVKGLAITPMGPSNQGGFVSSSTLGEKGKDLEEVYRDLIELKMAVSYLNAHMAALANFERSKSPQKKPTEDSKESAKTKEKVQEVADQLDPEKLIEEKTTLFPKKESEKKEGQDSGPEKGKDGDPPPNKGPQKK